jgi:hypothetical protein
MLKTLGNIGGGQPGTTWDNLFSEVVPPLYVDFTALMKRGDGGDNLFVSLACGGKGRRGSFPVYRRSWQKVAQVARIIGKWRAGSEIIAGNLENEVARGCPRLPKRGVL